MTDSAASTASTADVVVSLAVTLDGYIARTDGSFDYLNAYPVPGFDFDKWAGKIGALIMGRKSYEVLLNDDWAWGDRPTMVLTTRTDLPIPAGADVVFSAAPTAQAVRDFAAATPKRLWVFGGGDVVTAAVQGGAVDVLDIVVMPEALGSGIPLFTEPVKTPMRLVEATPFADGSVRLVYELG